MLPFVYTWCGHMETGMAERGEPVKVGVREFRGRLSEYLKQARQGARFTIMSRGEPIAELGAPSETEAEKPRRVLGAMKGQIWIADDFDEWPEGFLDIMEGKHEEL
jgi:antitoxin (DNA-binding transcriptional repressor) of toxin-antitoxin stability system